MSGKPSSDVQNFHRLLSPSVVALVTALDANNKPNTMVAAWHMPVSMNPPLVAVAISPLRHTHDLILASSEFTVCIPGKSMLRQVEYVGTVSGRTKDKSLSFKYAKAEKVRAPVIRDCLGYIECSLRRVEEMGDHSVFFGDVLHSCPRETEVWAVSPLLHLGSGFYAEFSPLIIKTNKY